MHRNPNVTNSARPEHGTLARRKFGLMAPEEPAGDPDAAEPQVSRDSPGDTMGTGGTYRRETGTGERKRQRALLACSHLEDKDEERGTPEWQRALNVCSQQGGEVGGTPTLQRVLPACIHGMEGYTSARPRAPPACIQDMEEGGGHATQHRALPAHSQDIEGDTPNRQRAPPERIQGMGEGG